MKNLLLQSIASSKIAQIDLYGLLSTYFSEHMFLIIGGVTLLIVFMLLLSKKMTDKPANKNFSSKTTSKQGQYKKFK